MSERPALCPAGLYGVSFHYGRLAVLRDLDLEVGAGEIVALLGANGSGKTTMFSVLLGLAQPSRGDRRFAGRVVAEVGEGDRAKIAYLSHQPQVYRGLDARENLELFARLRGESRGRSLTERIDEVLRAVDLQHAGRRVADTFSRGMLQRLSLASVLMKQADLIILDEPFTALDRQGRAQLAELLRAEKQRGASILFSSHDLDAVAGVAERTVILEAGRISEEIVRTPDMGPEAFRACMARASSTLRTAGADGVAQVAT